jgi:3D (Asp-Asp-Asp) domain-containing protein
MRLWKTLFLLCLTTGASMLVMPHPAARQKFPLTLYKSSTPSSVKIQSIGLPTPVTVASSTTSTTAPSTTTIPTPTTTTYLSHVSVPSSVPIASSRLVSTRATTTTTTEVRSSGGADLGEFEITCYALNGRTADGDQTSWSSAAVDPAVIPLGTWLSIPGIPNPSRKADDTGGGVRGHHIDIWESSTSACEQFGVQYHEVYRES